MSYYYEHGELVRVRFKREPEQRYKPRLCAVGTRFIFARGNDPGQLVMVAVA